MIKYHAQRENGRFIEGRGEVRVGLLLAVAIILVLVLVIEPVQHAARTT